MLQAGFICVAMSQWQEDESFVFYTWMINNCLEDKQWHKKAARSAFRIFDNDTEPTGHTKFKLWISAAKIPVPSRSGAQRHDAKRCRYQFL